MRARSLACCAFVAALALPVRNAGADAIVPIALLVDTRDVARGIVHVQTSFSTAGGPVTLVFPKWVAGEHAPANPLNDLAALRATADGQPVAWTRDPYDLYAFTFAAPAKATSLVVNFDELLDDGHATSRLALVDWNPGLLLPVDYALTTTQIAASMIVPAGWDSATALDAPKRTGDLINFAPVSVERLIDSPVLIGANMAHVATGPDAMLDVASDSPAAPVVAPAIVKDYTTLVTQAETLFGSRHWRTPYHFLMTASDTISYTGLEHHESSWNGVDTDTLETVEGAKQYAGDLLTHEFTHSWNGKFRRPAGLVKPDYQQPETTDLLWVYEGLTEYYSDVLAVRSGFWTPADFRAALAVKYADLDAQSGRTTRTLADTTFDERLALLAAPHPGYAGARRAGYDYYDEGELVWLDADTLIRSRSHGRRSLDDFARAFFGVGGATGPAILPYARADVVAALNAVEPYDWEGFFAARIDTPTPHPPLAGITRGGYALAFVEKPETLNPSKRLGGGADDYRFDLGTRISKTGTVTDVVAGSPGADSGVVPGMTIVAVDGRRYAAGDLAAALKRHTTSKAPMTLLVTNHEAFATLTVSYAGGIKLPSLTRADGPDLIGAIVSPRRTPAP